MQPLSAQETPNLKLAQALENNGRFEEALLLYRKIYNSGNQTLQVVEGIKKSLTELRRYEELVLFFEDLNQKYPQQLNYRIDLAKAYYLAGKESRAFETWRMVYESEPKNPTAYRLVGITLIELRLYDQAIEVYHKAIRNTEKQEALYRDIAVLYRAQLNYEKTVENLLLYYTYLKNQLNFVRSQLIAMSNDADATVRIINALKTFLEENYSNDELLELLATMYIKTKQFDSAFAIYESLQNQKNDQNFLARFASEAEDNQAYDYAIRAYQILINTQDQHRLGLQFHYKMARNYYLLGRKNAALQLPETAEQQVQTAIQILDNQIAAHKKSAELIASIELKADIQAEYYNDLDKAIESYQEILTIPSNQDTENRIELKLGNLFLLKNDMEEAKKYYEKVSGKRYGNWGSFNLAELEYYKAQFNSAKKQYQDLLAQIATTDSLSNDVLDRILLLEQFSSDSVQLAQFSKGELFRRQNKKSEAAKEFKELFLKNKALSFKAGIMTAIIYRDLYKLQDCEEVLKSMLSFYTGHEALDRVYYFLGELYYLQKHYQQGLENYQQILLSYPGSFYLEEARDRARTIGALLEKETQK